MAGTWGRPSRGAHVLEEIVAASRDAYHFCAEEGDYCVSRLQKSRGRPQLDTRNVARCSLKFLLALRRGPQIPLCSLTLVRARSFARSMVNLGSECADDDDVGNSRNKRREAEQR